MGDLEDARAEAEGGAAAMAPVPRSSGSAADAAADISDAAADISDAADLTDNSVTADTTDSKGDHA